MSRLERLVWLTLLTTAAWAVTVVPASAYVDPGTTTVIFQVVVAALAAAGLSVRVAWGRIRGLFDRRRRGQPAASVVTTATDDGHG